MAVTFVLSGSRSSKGSVGRVITFNAMPFGTLAASVIHTNIGGEALSLALEEIASKLSLGLFEPLDAVIRSQKTRNHAQKLETVATVTASSSKGVAKPTQADPDLALLGEYAQ